ncbi:MAG TPA: hypothetical protein VEJ20_04840, partial [Candidatus Eremiobacteraceae bacterium]|nr:hypothetical protein [Candidatus Eremiobacteraceae bacterium]
YGGGIAWSDDSVWVDLWPGGAGGFQYQFESNPNGSHNEASSENASFAPQWESHGRIGGDGYTVTMAIPLAVVHGAHAGTWKAQFVRYVRSTGALDVWSYDAAQTNPDDVSRAGSMTVPVVARAPLPKPRLGVYGLGAMPSNAVGGSKSTEGADFSVPVTQTAAVFGTVHPDYSNVELDQQSISPTIYQRIYNEVRPFFTQAASYYGDFNCNVCNGFRTTLYTPSIPTPLDGYAFEGRQGDYGLAAFDAIGAGRTDAASALNYTSPDSHWNAALQHVTADLPGLVDDSNQAGVSWFNGKYLSTYLNWADDAGTDVNDPSQGQWIDGGGGFISQSTALFGSIRKVGSEFDPVDGFDSHPGIAGYGLYGARVWTFPAQDFLSSTGISLFGDRYQGITQGVAQSDNQILADFLTKDTIDFQIFSGSDYWRFPAADLGLPVSLPPQLAPISQNAGFSLTYHSGMQNNLNNFPTHGSSATPTSVQYYTGQYGDGRLDTWFRSSTMRIGSRGSLTLSLDDTAQWLRTPSPACGTPTALSCVQWFDGASYAYQVGPDSSFAIGLRRVAGVPPQPNGGGDCNGTLTTAGALASPIRPCSNVSIAYHLRFRDEEVYAAYGNPNTLTTVPQALLKVIFYFGGQKGT